MKLITVLLTALSITTFCQAADLPPPSGKVILTVTGNITNTQDGESANFDLKSLKQLKSATFNLHTRWTERVHEYHGPLLTSILQKVGAKGDKLRLTALNDYTIEIDRAYVEKYQPILAWRDDGKQMSVRDKGPLWLLLPHDKFPELKSESNTGNMIWQLRHIEIK